MSRLVLVSALLVALLPVRSVAEISFYSLDTSFNPMRFVGFDSDPGNPAVNILGEVSGFSSAAAFMDLSSDGRLFVAPLGGTVYELDPNSGMVLGSVAVSTNVIEGLAVSDAGLIYAMVEDDGLLYAVDFDQGLVTPFPWASPEIDGLDFDNDGNLIGNDINDSGNFYEIPLDGSPPQLIANLPASDTPYTSFSTQESAFYFKDTHAANNGQGLYRLPWSSGLPAGPLEYVKDIGSGTYVGIAAIPEPSTAALLGAASVLALRRRRRAASCRRTL